jgi:hypothetical protein
MSIHGVREKVYGKFTDNDIVFMFIVSLMNDVGTVQFIYKLI